MHCPINGQCWSTLPMSQCSIYCPTPLLPPPFVPCLSPPAPCPTPDSLPHHTAHLTTATPLLATSPYCILTMPPPHYLGSHLTQNDPTHSPTSSFGMQTTMRNTEATTQTEEETLLPLLPTPPYFHVTSLIHITSPIHVPCRCHWPWLHPCHPSTSPALSPVPYMSMSPPLSPVPYMSTSPGNCLPPPCHLPGQMAIHVNSPVHSTSPIQCPSLSLPALVNAHDPVISPALHPTVTQCFATLKLFLANLTMFTLPPAPLPGHFFGV